MAMGSILNQTTSALPLSNGVYDAGNKRIVNVADPVNDGDAVNKGWVEQNAGGYEQYKKRLIHQTTNFSDTFTLPRISVEDWSYIGIFFQTTLSNVSTTANYFTIQFLYGNELVMLLFPQIDKGETATGTINYVCYFYRVNSQTFGISACYFAAYSQSQLGAVELSFTGDAQYTIQSSASKVMTGFISSSIYLF